MPGLNQQGPAGQGPKTGRGLGKCNPDFKTSETEQPTFGGRGRAGKGRRRGMGHCAQNNEHVPSIGWRKGRGSGFGFGTGSQQQN